MNEFITKPENIRRLEFWAATTIYVFAIFLLVSSVVQANGDFHRRAALNDYVYNLVAQSIRFTVLYGAFLFLNFYIAPRLLRREALVVNILSVVLLVVLAGGIFAVTNTFLKYNMVPGSYRGGSMHAFTFGNSFLYAAWLVLLFGIYTAMKQGILHLLARTQDMEPKRRTIVRNALTAFLLWILSVFCLAVIANEARPVLAWAVLSVFAVSFYGLCYYRLIPRSLASKRPFRSFLGKAFLVLVVAIFPVFVLFMPIMGNEDPAMAMAMSSSLFHLCLTTPLSWILFKRHLKGKEEMYVLKKELGQTHANFDFLRSQINPHFLFNALNTIYGTALQEGAERTGEGVQRLGDMMRFMLQENMQEKISLAREIEYLQNYISLQRLRTDASPTVQIEAAIEQPLVPVQIAPMLLIPFVENAFKHGISFREPSHIKVALEVRDHTLNFDVYNSKHLRTDSDPEKDKSGIGLVNVKQRLSLLYPGKHELIIRETGKEFFVHLTIQLT